MKGVLPAFTGTDDTAYENATDSMNSREQQNADDEGLELSRDSINVKGDSAKTLSAFPGGKCSIADASKLEACKLP